MVALSAAAPSALPYILGIFFLLTPPAPFLSLYTEKVIAALPFPRLPLLYTRPDDDFLDEDDVALFETTAVSLPSSSMSISRSRKKNACKPYLYSVEGWFGRGLRWGRRRGNKYAHSRVSFTCAWFHGIIILCSFLLRNTFFFCLYVCTRPSI